ncbi:MAG: UDP-N-acetylglucosamine 2-epimerase (non-hydrolyzing) [Candidatus Hydrothermarchaeales archaeon]
MKPFIVASTRPELIKLAPVLREFDSNGVEYIFITTGQHYDAALFHKFVDDLELKKPDHDIETGSGSQAYQTSDALLKLEKLMMKEKPDIVIAEGDTNSVLSTALAAVKLHQPFAHVESGLRSFDMHMPEEVNRIVADHCSQVLFAPTDGAGLNLLNEGIPPDRIHIVGNTVVDAVQQNIRIAKSKSAIELPTEYALLTLHRPENVDSRKGLSNIVEALLKLEFEVLFPCHPRTMKMLKKFGLFKKLGEQSSIKIIAPLGYFDFIHAMSRAKVVLTDSGGIQEESLALHVPCLTLRDTTERPESVTSGGNILVGTDPKNIIEKLEMVLGDKKLYSRMKRAKNPFGDGKSGKRIVKILLDLHRDGKLAFSAPDFKGGFWKRRFVAVDSSIAGKRIKDLEMTVFKLMVDGEEKYPHGDTVLKKGQLIEIRS